MAVDGVSDAAVRKATGKGWGEWYSLLDSAGAREMTHRQIVSVVGTHESGGWWQQTITATYERARGLGDKHQRIEGFAVTASKVIKAGVTRIYAAWAEETVRNGWLDASGWTIRKSTPCKSLRITWCDGRTHVDVHLWPRDVAKALVQVEHTRLATADDVQRLKAFWGVALERLREMLETADQPHSLAA
ncbi:MAG: hypothetical protein IT580_04150 [Verrucomicrobiales bacterium]|nr:hypothetical protein [Verrucomicrobiales bacterium]